MDEEEILESLDALLSDTEVRNRIDEIVSRVEKDLKSNSDSVMAWEPVPLEIYDRELPGSILSSWVFILRANVTTGAERHPNSIQRMTSFYGSGDFQTKPGEEWISHLLSSDGGAPLMRRWISIPENVWHQGVVPDENWVVVSFQTASVEDLIEERPDPEDLSVFRRKTYVDREN